MTRITVIKPFVYTNATDPIGVVHRVVSLAGVMNLCTARCGLEGKWGHAETRRWASTTVTMTWTDESPSCMTCIVMEARRAAA
jgi:hypothetical protein